MFDHSIYITTNVVMFKCDRKWQNDRKVLQEKQEEIKKQKEKPTKDARRELGKVQEKSRIVQFKLRDELPQCNFWKKKNNKKKNNPKSGVVSNNNAKMIFTSKTNIQLNVPHSVSAI